MLRNGHVRFGGRPAETHTVQTMQGAAGRPYTYVRTWEGWLYLAVVMDAHSRRVIGWAIDETKTADLVEDALKMAKTMRDDLPAKVIFHSDKGTQGGFKWLSQHLDDGGVRRWLRETGAGRLGRSPRVCGVSGVRIVRCVRRCVPLAGRLPHERCSVSSGH